MARTCSIFPKPRFVSGVNADIHQPWACNKINPLHLVCWCLQWVLTSGKITGKREPGLRLPHQLVKAAEGITDPEPCRAWRCHYSQIKGNHGAWQVTVNSHGKEPPWEGAPRQDEIQPPLFSFQVRGQAEKLSPAAFIYSFQGSGWWSI